jgi:hypothetical protein
MKNHYRWSHPYAWLIDASKYWDKERLLYELQRLAIQHDSDTLQNLYQSEMDEDGYFEPLIPVQTGE